MQHNQPFQEERFRVSTYVNQELKQLVTFHAKLRGISESQLVAKLLEKEFLKTAPCSPKNNS